MADNRERRTNSDRYYMALIFGVLAGVIIASITGQWWWVAVGALIGGVVGLGRDRIRPEDRP